MTCINSRRYLSMVTNLSNELYKVYYQDNMMHTIIVHIFKYAISITCHALKTVHLKMYTQKCILKNVYLKNMYFLNYLFMLSR